MINQFIFVSYTYGSFSVHGRECRIHNRSENNKKGHGMTEIIDKAH